MRPKRRAAKLARDVLPPALIAAALALGQGWERFPALVWTGRAEERELVAAFGGACVERTAATAWLAERGLDFLVFNAPGRDDLHLDRDSPRFQSRWQRWYEARDPALAVREPCLRDPTTRERLRARLAESLQAHRERPGLGFSLGDEVGLTPGGGPGEECLCATCREVWRARGGEGELEQPSTDAVLAALRAGSDDLLGAWLARRRFHESALYESLAELAALARRELPGAPVGLLGIAGKTAFDGVDVPRALELADFAECYAEGNARELLFTLRGPRQRTLATVFVDPRGPDASARQVWEHFVRGGDGIVVWSAADLARAPAHRERLLRAVRDVRVARAASANFRPAPRGVALVHSADSIAVAWLRDAIGDGATWPKRFASYQEANGALEGARRRWLDLLEACGAQPGAVPIERVGAETARRFPALVLDTLLVLDSTAGLEAYAAAGGTLLVRGEVGTYDAAGRRRQRSPLAELREKHGERVLDLPQRVAAAIAGSGARRGARDELCGVLGRCGVELRPWIEKDDGFEWLAAWSRDAATGEIACAALPKPGANGAWPARADLGAPDGYELAWVHPRATAAETPALPPGDAAVFRLVLRR